MVQLAWSDIEAVEPRDGAVTLRARGGSKLVIGTGRFAPDERIRLERTIARRVTEAALDKQVLVVFVVPRRRGGGAPGGAWPALPPSWR